MSKGQPNLNAAPQQMAWIHAANWKIIAPNKRLRFKATHYTRPVHVDRLLRLHKIMRCLFSDFKRLWSHLPMVKTSCCLSTVQSLKEIKISHVLWGIYRSSNLVIIENNPSTIFKDMCNIVTTLSRGSNVAHNSNKSISCIQQVPTVQTLKKIHAHTPTLADVFQ